MRRKNRWFSLPAAVVLALAVVPLALAHPAIEGGLKHGFAGVKDFGGGHVELVADARTNSVRVYISEAQDQPLPNNKNHEWVINMTVRKGKAGRKDVVLLPLRDPGPGKEWFAVAPVQKTGGYVFYRVEVTARIMLDGKASRTADLKFAAGRDPRGTACFSAPVNLARAKTIRFLEVKVSILDAKGAKAAVVKPCFNKMAWGLGKLHRNIQNTDFPLATFAQYIGKSREMDKFRKPQAPKLTRR